MRRVLSSRHFWSTTSEAGTLDPGLTRCIQTRSCCRSAGVKVADCRGFAIPKGRRSRARPQVDETRVLVETKLDEHYAMVRARFSGVSRSRRRPPDRRRLDSMFILFLKDGVASTSSAGARGLPLRAQRARRIAGRDHRSGSLVPPQPGRRSEDRAFFRGVAGARSRVFSGSLPSRPARVDFEVLLRPAIAERAPRGPRPGARARGGDDRGMERCGAAADRRLRDDGARCWDSGQDVPRSRPRSVTRRATPPPSRQR